MTLYIKTTNDKYELPLIVEDSYHVLAAKMGLKPKTVANMCCTEKGGYYKVKIKDDMELKEDFWSVPTFEEYLKGE